MNNKQLAEKVVKKAVKLGADEAEAYIVSDRSFELSVRNGEVETVKQSTSKGLGLTVYKDKKLGVAYTSDLSASRLDNFITMTIQLSLIPDAKPWNSLPQFKQGTLENLDLYDQSISSIPNEKKIAIAREVERIALASDKRIVETEGGYFEDSEADISIINSTGISYNKKISGIYFGTGVIAREGEDMQQGWWGSYKRHFEDLDDIEEVSKKAVREAIERLGPRSVKTQKVPVIYYRDIASGLWYGILNAMDGDQVFKKTSFLSESLGTQIMPPFITIVDNPTIPRHVASTPFDGEGNITKEHKLIENGILKNYIYDSITARKAKVKVHTTAQRYGYKTTAYAAFLNVMVNNGKTSTEKLINSIKNGLFIKGVRGIGTDSTTGNYSCGASGYWIENGELAYPVDGITLGGNVRDMLNNIEALADDREMKRSINSPSLKISEMTVGGKNE